MLGYLFAVLLGAVGFFLSKILYLERNKEKSGDTLKVSLLAFSSIAIMTIDLVLAIKICDVMKLDGAIFILVAWAPLGLAALLYRERGKTPRS